MIRSRPRSYVWTKEHRDRQAQAIHRWEPWTKSTGARTPAGKAITSRNSIRHGLRSREVRAYRQLDRSLRRDPFNFDLVRKTDEALIVACNYVLQCAMCNNDAVSRMRAILFVQLQMHRAMRRLSLVTFRWDDERGFMSVGYN